MNLESPLWRRCYLHLRWYFFLKPSLMIITYMYVLGYDDHCDQITYDDDETVLMGDGWYYDDNPDLMIWPKYLIFVIFLHSHIFCPEFLHSKVREFTTKKASRLCVKLHTVCKLLHRGPFLSRSIWQKFPSIEFILHSRRGWCHQIIIEVCRITWRRSDCFVSLWNEYLHCRFLCVDVQSTRKWFQLRRII